MDEGEVNLLAGSSMTGPDTLVMDMPCAEGPGVCPPETSAGLRPVAAVVQSVAVKVLIVGINALTGIITARFLGPGGRGELAAMILFPVFLGSALSFGLPSALTYQLRRSPQKAGSLMGAGLVLASMTGLAGALLGAIFMHSWIPQYPPQVIWFARIFLLSTPITSLLLVGRAALESRGDFTASNKLLIWSPATTLVLLGILIATSRMSPFTAAISYVLVGVMPLAWMVFRVSKALRPSLTGLRGSVSTLFSYGVRSYGIDLCGTMSLYVDQALVVRLLNPDLMGTYVVGLSLSRMLNVFHTSVVMVLFPRAVGRAPAEVAEMTSRAMRVTTAMTTVCGIAIAVFGPEMLVLLYGREYQGAGLLLRILIAEVILSGATQVLSQAFMALERPGIIAGLQLTGLLLTIPLMLLLVPRFGILGAGLALLASTCARLSFVVFSFPVFLKLKIPRLVPAYEDLKFAVSAITSWIHQSRSAANFVAAGVGD